jgi:putative tricarboxylic transport membrane protein
MPGKGCLHLALACAMALLAASCPRAAEWRPLRPVELVTPGAAGGGPDLAARLIQRLAAAQRLIEVPVVVLNRPGGNHAAAWNYLHQHPADGHQLMIASLGLIAGSLMGANAIPAGEIAPIVQLFTEYLVLAARAEAAPKSAREVVERLRADPGSFSIAAAGDGAGSVNHLAAAQALKAAGTDIRRLRVVHFKSSSEAAVAVAGGHVDLVVSHPAALLPHTRAGRLRPLAVSAPARFAGELAAVPTWRELGVEVVSSNLRVVLGPRGLKAEQIRYWEGVFWQLVRSEEWKRDLEQHHRHDAFFGHEESRAAWRRLHEEIAVLLAELGLARR